MKIRLQKFLSQAGVGSRRKAEEMIGAGKVKVNDLVVKKMGVLVDPEKDVVKFMNKKIKPREDLVYYIFNKPEGYICSRYDPKEKKTIYNLLPKDLRNKVWYVGRLDKDSSGLVILTNDGDLTLRLTHPRYGHEKEYEVELDKKLASKDKQVLEKGIKLDGKKTLPLRIYKIAGPKLRVVLREGKKRQIRRMFGARNYKVEKLKRVRVGKLRLGDLQAGRLRSIKKGDIISGS